MLELAPPLSGGTYPVQAADRAGRVQRVRSISGGATVWKAWQIGRGGESRMEKAG